MFCGSEEAGRGTGGGGDGMGCMFCGSEEAGGGVEGKYTKSGEWLRAGELVGNFKLGNWGEFEGDQVRRGDRGPG